MRAKSTTTEEQIYNILECRQSGLDVYQWCTKTGIAPTTYYNWVTRLRKKGITLPESIPNQSAILPTSNEIVPLAVIPQIEPINYNEHQNARITHLQTELSQLAVEILLGGTTIRFFNNTAAHIVEATLKNLGGGTYDR